ncbi:MAG: cytochrome b/b6 domain-containing protein [Alphaproteobacteria bacterium]|nr:cytochrome b/b6 domain-containing protein [Alphaproteobacteria bacterium]
MRAATDLAAEPAEGAAQAAPVPAAPRTVKVWDIVVRVFHWSLVAAFATAFISGDDAERIHVLAGYTVLGLIALRLVWGVVGTKHARFASFVVGPQRLGAYLRDMGRGRAPRHLGHNPAGAAMIVTLLAMLLATGGTGWLAYQGGPTAHALEEVHEFLANATLALVAAHILGVIVSSLLHRENLVRSMFTGRKRAEDGVD